MAHIKHPARLKQLVSYEGLGRHRNIRPSDIDGLLDYSGTAFVYLECKHEDKFTNGGLDGGQKSALQNVTDSHRKAGHMAEVIVFTHSVPVNDTVIARDQTVKEIYFDGAWHKIDGKITVVDAIDKFEKYCTGKGYRL